MILLASGALHRPNLPHYSQQYTAKCWQQKQIAIALKEIVDGKKNDADNDKNDTNIIENLFHNL